MNRSVVALFAGQAVNPYDPHPYCRLYRDLVFQEFSVVGRGRGGGTSWSRPGPPHGADADQDDPRTRILGWLDKPLRDRLAAQLSDFWSVEHDPAGPPLEVEDPRREGIAGIPAIAFCRVELLAQFAVHKLDEFRTLGPSYEYDPSDARQCRFWAGQAALFGLRERRALDFAYSEDFRLAGTVVGGVDEEVEEDHLTEADHGAGLLGEDGDGELDGPRRVPDHDQDSGGSPRTGANRPAALLDVDSTSDDVIVYVGANVKGEDGHWYGRHFPKTKIHFFEPSRIYFQELLANYIKIRMRTTKAALLAAVRLARAAVALALMPHEDLPPSLPPADSAGPTEESAGSDGGSRKEEAASEEDPRSINSSSEVVVSSSEMDARPVLPLLPVTTPPRSTRHVDAPRASENYDSSYDSSNGTDHLLLSLLEFDHHSCPAWSSSQCNSSSIESMMKNQLANLTATLQLRPDHLFFHNMGLGGHQQREFILGLFGCAQGSREIDSSILKNIQRIYDVSRTSSSSSAKEQSEERSGDFFARTDMRKRMPRGLENVREELAVETVPARPLWEVVQELEGTNLVYDAYAGVLEPGMVEAVVFGAAEVSSAVVGDLVRWAGGMVGEIVRSCQPSLRPALQGTSSSRITEEQRGQEDVIVAEMDTADGAGGINGTGSTSSSAPSRAACLAAKNAFLANVRRIFSGAGRMLSEGISHQHQDMMDNSTVVDRRDELLSIVDLALVTALRPVLNELNEEDPPLRSLDLHLTAEQNLRGGKALQVLHMNCEGCEFQLLGDEDHDPKKDPQPVVPASGEVAMGEGRRVDAPPEDARRGPPPAGQEIILAPVQEEAPRPGGGGPVEQEIIAPVQEAPRPGGEGPAESWPSSKTSPRPSIIVTENPAPALPESGAPAPTSSTTGEDLLVRFATLNVATHLLFTELEDASEPENVLPLEVQLSELSTMSRGAESETNLEKAFKNAPKYAGRRGNVRPEGAKIAGRGLQTVAEMLDEEEEGIDAIVLATDDVLGEEDEMHQHDGLVMGEDHHVEAGRARREAVAGRRRKVGEGSDVGGSGDAADVDVDHHSSHRRAARQQDPQANHNRPPEEESKIFREGQDRSRDEEDYPPAPNQPGRPPAKIALRSSIKKYCEMHRRLARTHTFVQGLPWIWERWERKCLWRRFVSCESRILTHLRERMELVSGSIVQTEKGELLAAHGNESAERCGLRVCEAGGGGAGGGGVDGIQGGRARAGANWRPAIVYTGFVQVQGLCFGIKAGDDFSKHDVPRPGGKDDNKVFSHDHSCERTERMILYQFRRR